MLGPVALTAQEDSVMVLPSDRYEAGTLTKMLLGAKYRDLWSTPIQLPLLSPDTFAGGLRVIRRGNSLQTISLLFEAPDGREFFFRSVDKEQNEGLPEDLKNTLFAYLAQDQVSSKHPGAAVVVAALLESAGVLHATPRLAVMADHALLGAHRDRFAGMLGMIEERPNENAAAESAFGRYERVIGSERLMERIRESPSDRVDAPAYLTARMMDFLVGDWDRHPDQWRWAQDDREGVRYWLPIPRDRDNALPYMDGVIGAISGLVRTNTSQFERDYTDIEALVYNAQPLDRRILGQLPRATWESIAAQLQSRLTDEVIGRAVRELPRQWWPLEAESLAEKLRTRRDSLGDLAHEIYGRVAMDVDLFGTDEAETARVDRMPDGSLRVRLSTLEAQGTHILDRTFIPSETHEVRLYLGGGDDRATVTGSGGRIDVRILGEEGDDAFLDESDTRSGAITAFYDNRGNNSFSFGNRTRLDRRTFAPPEAGFPPEGNRPPPRDWGRSHALFTPRAIWQPEVGPVIGGGPTWTRFGFRRFPSSGSAFARLMFAPRQSRFAVEAGARRMRTGGGGFTAMHASVSDMSFTNFHGFGNETPSIADSQLYRVWAREAAFSAELVEEPRPGFTIALTPQVRITEPEVNPESPAAMFDVAGDGAFGVVGLRANASFDRRDSAEYPRRGLQLDLYAGGFPLVWGDAREAFTEGGGSATAYLPIPGPLEPTLALRAAAHRVWGTAPFQHAAFLGGASTLRGYRLQRFAGDAAAHGRGELRVRLGYVNLYLLRGELGGIALADAGRVFVSEEESDRWHTGFGGGFWFGTFDRAATAHLVYARGERHTLQAGIGVPF